MVELDPDGMLTVVTPQRDDWSETVAPPVYAAPAEVWTLMVTDVGRYIRTVVIELGPGEAPTCSASIGGRSSG